jgi:coenzyme F420-reducing hydrogenase delta subunit
VIIGADGTGSESCSVANFRIIGVECSGSTTTVLVLKHLILATLRHFIRNHLWKE